jgi:hypothetical protein
MTSKGWPRSIEEIKGVFVNCEDELIQIVINCFCGGVYTLSAYLAKDNLCNSVHNILKTLLDYIA